MPQEITRHELEQLLDQGAQLVEVLPANEYQEDHRPGAVNLPLRKLEKGLGDEAGYEVVATPTPIQARALALLNLTPRSV